MPSERDINAFVAKRTKASMVLELLLNREYVTCSDIINIYRMYDKDCDVPFTTCPHKLIENIRKHFGYDFVQDREVKFFRKFYKGNGQEYRVSDVYKQYFLNKVGV